MVNRMGQAPPAMPAMPPMPPATPAPAVTPGTMAATPQMGLPPQHDLISQVLMGKSPVQADPRMHSVATALAKLQR